MKTLDLNAMGVTEMTQKEMKEVSGGGFFKRLWGAIKKLRLSFGSTRIIDPNAPGGVRSLPTAILGYPINNNGPREIPFSDY